MATKTVRYLGKTKSSAISKPKRVKAAASKRAKALLYVPEGVSPKDRELRIEVVAVDRKTFAAMAMRRT